MGARRALHSKSSARTSVAKQVFRALPDRVALVRIDERDREVDVYTFDARHDPVALTRGEQLTLVSALASRDVAVNPTAPRIDATTWEFARVHVGLAIGGYEETAQTLARFVFRFAPVVKRVEVELVDAQGGSYYEVRTPDVVLEGRTLAQLRDAIDRQLGARTLPPNGLRWALV